MKVIYPSCQQTTVFKSDFQTKLVFELGHDPAHSLELFPGPLPKKSPMLQLSENQSNLFVRSSRIEFHLSSKYPKYAVGRRSVRRNAIQNIQEVQRGHQGIFDRASQNETQGYFRKDAQGFHYTLV